VTNYGDTIDDTLSRLHADDAVDTSQYALAVAVAKMTVLMAGLDMWDANAQLCFVTRNVADDSTTLRLNEVSIELWLNDGDDPLILLERLAAAMKHNPADVALLSALHGVLESVDVVGWIYTTECWMVEAKSAADLKAAFEHQLHEHPNRREARVITMVDRAGVVYQTTTIRGRDEPTMRVLDSPGSDDEIQLGGRVIQVLMALIDATPVA
jgi:hypothetical protein